MPNSIHVQLADAVVTELNHASRSWTGSLTAERTWKPWRDTQTEIAALDSGLKVFVVPLTIEDERLDRARIKYDYGIALDFQKSLDITAAGYEAAVDALDKLAQDVQDFYQDGHAIMTGYVVLESHRRDVYSLDKMYAEQLWETLVMLGIRGHR